MTKKGKVIVGSALALLLSLFLLYEFYWKEPSYKGRGLSEWLSAAENASPGQRAEIIGAVQHIGKRALPYAFAMLHATDSPFQQEVVRFMNEYTVFKVEPLVPEERLRARAILALVALRNQARERITRRLGQELQQTSCCPQVLQVLAFMGTNGLPHLLKALTNQLPQIRVSAAFALCQPQWTSLETNRGHLWLDAVGLTQDELRDTSKAFSAAAVPSLQRCLTDSDPGVRRAAAIALDAMDQRPTNSIPIFIAGLRDRDAPERRTSANYLGHFGNAAAEAVPALTHLLEDPDPEVRSAAQRALKKIDPSALDKAINSQPRTIN